MGKDKIGYMDIIVPGDKSIAQRAIILGAIADGKSTLHNFPLCDDTLSAIRCVRALGIKVEINQPKHKVVIYGKGLYGLTQPKRPLDAGESGTTARILAGLLAAQPFSSILTGRGTLMKRPMKRVIEPLRQMGAHIEGREAGRFAPLCFIPGTGDLRPLSWDLPVPSAQVKSSLLLAALRASGPTRIGGKTGSRDHTERMLRALGVRLDRQGSALTLLAACAMSSSVAFSRP